MYSHISNVNYIPTRRERMASLTVVALVSLATVGFALARFVA